MININYWNIIAKINKNIRMKGNRTIAHAIFVAPVLHIRLRIQVQNNIYNSFTTKIKPVLVTSQLKFPRQYTFLLPKFCIDAMNTKNNEITK